MKRVVIVGATSGIGLEVARLFIEMGCAVGVAGRNEAVLQSLHALCPERVCYAVLDVTREESAASLLSLIARNGGMDLFLLSSGVGQQNRDLQPAIELNTIETNCVGFTRMMGEAFRHFRTQGSGHLAAISSIAGTQALGAAPAYSASKRFQNHYINTLAQLARMERLNITFTDVRPGFVRTPLLKRRYPMTLDVSYVARCLVDALLSKRRVAIIDWRYRAIVFFWSLIPRCVWERIRVG